jgi:hypothetical protein
MGGLSGPDARPNLDGSRELRDRRLYVNGQNIVRNRIFPNGRLHSIGFRLRGRHLDCGALTQPFEFLAAARGRHDVELRLSRIIHDHPLHHGAADLWYFADAGIRLRQQYACPGDGEQEKAEHDPADQDFQIGQHVQAVVGTKRSPSA